MKKYISKQTELNLLKLGLYQVIGGVAGIIVFIWLFYRGQVFTLLAFVPYMFVLVFFLYSIYCGILCMKVKKAALTHSFINQLLQLVPFTVFGFAFKYVAGIGIMVGFDLTHTINFTFDADISSFAFGSINDPADFVIEINLIALVLVIWIDKLRTKVHEELEVRKISSIVSSIGNKYDDSSFQES
ncbi:hypothetical protein [Ferruginibacter sp.]|uniref:hypothetical protein n=1 Tax=Ferruginibacter sp. TaxID=1940288 RepID=UPI002659868B|nr:hypothetical protein [Ferruginibacter sp.]